MPNQRSKTKKYLGGYIEQPLHSKITRLAKKEGMAKNRFGFVAKLLEEALAKRRS